MTHPGPPKRLRILSICPQLTPAGAEQQLLRLCQHLDKTRFEMRVIYYEAAGDLRPAFEAAGTPVTHIDRAALGAWGLLRALRAEIQSQHPDVLDCRLPSAYRFGRLAALGAGVPVIVAQERTAGRGPWLRRSVRPAAQPLDGTPGWAIPRSWPPTSSATCMSPLTAFMSSTTGSTRTNSERPPRTLFWPASGRKDAGWS